MCCRQTRIFVPPTAKYATDWWFETAIGSVVAPAVSDDSGMRWFWFSRYHEPRASSGGDCSIKDVPVEFGVDDRWRSSGSGGGFRSIRLRYMTTDETVRRDLESRIEGLVTSDGCVVTDFRDYDHVGDLGGSRFGADEEAGGNPDERAALVACYLQAVCRLFLDCLSGPDNEDRYQIEASGDSENPHGSPFESLHHMFCNVTDVPLSVLVYPGGRICTRWSVPTELRKEPFQELLVRF